MLRFEKAIQNCKLIIFCLNRSIKLSRLKEGIMTYFFKLYNNIECTFIIILFIGKNYHNFILVQHQVCFFNNTTFTVQYAHISLKINVLTLQWIALYKTLGFLAHIWCNAECVTHCGMPNCIMSFDSYKSHDTNS